MYTKTFEKLLGFDQSWQVVGYSNALYFSVVLARKSRVETSNKLGTENRFLSSSPEQSPNIIFECLSLIIYRRYRIYRRWMYTCKLIHLIFFFILGLKLFDLLWIIWLLFTFKCSKIEHGTVDAMHYGAENASHFLINHSKTKTFIDLKVTRKPKPTSTRPYLNEIPAHFIHEIKTKGYDVISVNVLHRKLQCNPDTTILDITISPV